MDTLDRYLVSSFLSFFIVILFGSGLLFLGIDFFAGYWNLALPFHKLLLYYLYRAPGFLQQMLPLSCLLSMLLVLAQMSRQNETLALFAGGIGIARVVSTFLAVVAAVSTLAFLTFDVWIPLLNKRQIQIKSGVEVQAELPVVSQSGSLWFRSGHMVYNVGRFDSQAQVLKDLNVFSLDDQFQVTERVHAEEAKYQDGQWTLANGFTIAFPSANPFPVVTRFQTKKGVIQEKPADFANLRLRDETMRLRDLRKYIAQHEGSGLDTTVEKVRYHERLAFVFTPLLFMLVGIPFVLKPLKTYSTPKSVGLCLIVVLGYLLIFRLSLSLGLYGHLSPAVAGWSPNVLMLGVASYLLSRRG